VTKTGIDIIRNAARTMPQRPGVYRMLDARGEVLYVGKARSLKKRVLSYTRLGGHTNRIARMIQATAGMEIVTTASETDALLLEANLIKQLKPPFNVILRDDKSFPYILLARDHDVAQIIKHRGTRSKNGSYFGPFASAGAVNRTINALQKAFLLRSCSDSVYESRTRPCLLYQIKRCAAPCTGEISLADYDLLVRDAEQFLSGKSGKVKDQIARQMERAADALDFERAAVLRDRITALSQIQANQSINPQHTVEADIFAAYQEGSTTCIQVFFIRTGQNWGNRAYFPRADKELDAAHVLDAFIAQFYDNRPAPRLILLSHAIPNQALLAEALTIKSDRKVAVARPLRGEKRILVEHASSNARDALARRVAQSDSERKLLAGVADLFELDAPPRRIEVYDNSHIQGADGVGAMIVAGAGGFHKNQYRKFNMDPAKPGGGDDFAMMRAMLTRRFRRLLREHGPRDDNGASDTGPAAPWPDLVLIDGGQGQLTAAREVMTELGLDGLPLAAIAKGPNRDAGRETFHMTGRTPFKLEPRDPVLYYLQRLRDEAHRFAIGAHRTRRKQGIKRSPLDDIAGVGPGRKRALLRYFGSARAVARASLVDLEAVDSISDAMARRIHDHFNEQAD
jgi:excinuclease ABC subunit C